MCVRQKAADAGPKERPRTRRSSSAIQWLVISRRQIAFKIADLVGAEALVLQDAANGWPALAQLHADSETLPVAMFVGPVTLTQRDRDDIERRFQNPGRERPITILPGRLPLLVGLWDQDEVLPVPRPLLVTADPVRRQGLTTRYSIFVTVGSLLEASRTGWSEATNGAGEVIRCLLPSMLPMAAIADRLDAAPSSWQVQHAIEAAGLADTDADEHAAGRARRATMTLVRDARFAKRVVAAYGDACAMCGLGLGLVQGAHIYPAAAPRSSDEPWNGLALCANHHLAFDRHVVAVDPATMGIHFNWELLGSQPSNDALRAFATATFSKLTMPADQNLRPRPEMFEERYRHFAGSYDWLPSLDPPR